MSVIEDTRQVIQDFIAPQLKSLEVKVTDLETSVSQRFTSAEAVAKARHEALTAQIAQIEAVTNARHEGLLAQMDARHAALTAQIAQLANTVASNNDSVLQKLDLERRIERIELFQAGRFESAQAITHQLPTKP